jgi:SsrA-binding protein
MADFATNPKAFHDYEILETLEAGLVLSGHEVKSIKTGKVSIKGSYVKVLNGQPYLIGALISPYQPGNVPDDYREQADRKILITKSQLSSLSGLAQSHGITLVPLKLYDKKGLVKLEIGVARGKKMHDKREAIKLKDTHRAKQRGTHDA